MRIRCPIISCGVENQTPVSICGKCGVNLRAYAIALKFSDYCFNRSLTMAREGNYEAARVELSICLRFRPGDEESRLLLAEIHRLTGQKKSAILIWKQLTESAADPAIKERATRYLEAENHPGQRKKQGQRKKKKKRK